MFRTTTVTVWAAVWLPGPLSAATTVKVTVPGPSAGVQVKTPVTGSIAAPAGASTRLYVKSWDGRSATVAAAVKVRVFPSSAGWSGIGASTGGIPRTVIAASGVGGATSTWPTLS